MVLGGTTQQLFQLVKIDTQGGESLDALIKKQRALQKSSQQAASGINRTSQEMDNAAGSSKEASGQFGQMFGIGMNLMFMGMALQQVFGGLAGSMLKMTGVSQTFGAAAKSTLLPFFIAIAPLLNKVAFFFMELPKPIKMALGALVSLLAVLGTFLFFGSQVALLAISLQVSILALAGALATLLVNVFALLAVVATIVFVFKEFGNVAGIAATILGGALLASLMSATGGFQLLSLGIAKATGSTAALTASMFGLQFSMTSILLIAGALAASLLILDRVFKKFGPIVGFIATLIGGVLLAALSPVAAIILVIFGAFKAVNMILKKFSGIIKVVVGVIIAIIAVLVAVFVGTPLAIAAAVGAILAVIWNFKDGIVNIIQGVIDFILNLPKHFSNAMKATGNIINNFVSGVKKILKKLPGILKSFFVNAFQEKIDAVKNIFKGLKKFMSGIGDILGGNFKKGFKKVLEGLGTVIKGAINTALPLGLTIDKIAGFIDSGIGAAADVIGVNDFILTSGGQVLQPDSNDTIVGFNGNGPIQPGGGSGQITVEINDPVMKEDVDVERVVDEVEERVNRDSRGRTTGL